MLTGLPIDYERLCNFCVKCKNIECALWLWRRSEELHHLCYTVTFSVWDCKAFDAVVADCPYGKMSNLITKIV